MKKSRWSIPALGAFFVAAALLVSACGSSGVPSDSVATVSGNSISKTAIAHWMYIDAKQNAAQSPGEPVIVPNDPPDFTKCIAQARAAIPQLKKAKAATIKSDCSQLFTQLSSQVLGFLIQSYWYQGLAHQQGINVTDAQVQAAFDKAKKSEFKTSAQYTAFLKQSGETEADLKYRFRYQQIAQKLIKKHPTTVTAADISAFYAAHKTQFGTPQRRNMRIVLTKTASQAKTALAALKSGKSWNVVAKKYSLDPSTKDKGGQLVGVTAGQQDAALSKAAFAAPVNKLLGPVKGQFGYYVIDVTKITAATQKSLAQSQATIKQTLTQQKQQAAQTAVDNAAKKAYLAKTKCVKAYAMMDCSGYKAPKTSSTAAPGAATPTPTTPQSGATTPPSGATTPSSGGSAQSSTTSSK